MTRVEIDLNVRVRRLNPRFKGMTYSGMKQVDGQIQPGDTVEVYERESGLTGTGYVDSIDRARGIVYLAVDWAALRFAEEPDADHG